MKILYIAPLPPPITGHSLVSKTLLDSIEAEADVLPIDLSKNSFKEGISSIDRVIEILRVFIKVISNKKNANAVYFTISESLAGNLKDIFIYLLLGRRLLSKTYIHLHGGSIKRDLWDKYPLIHNLNKYFIKRLGGVIISGKSHLPIFENIVSSNKIHIIPNFASEHLFASEEIIRSKFDNDNPIRILYMSNLIEKKGYNELADAYISLEGSIQRQFKLDFAGAFDSPDDKDVFLKKIQSYPMINYHGVISEEEKRKLFFNTHIFCLPTSYLEGQPISILEAYSSGSVVLTTSQPGILDIFKDQENGFLINERSASSIQQTLFKVLESKTSLLNIGLNNFRHASSKYIRTNYTSAIKNIIGCKSSAKSVLI